MNTSHFFFSTRVSASVAPHSRGHADLLPFTFIYSNLYVQHCVWVAHGTFFFIGKRSRAHLIHLSLTIFFISKPLQINVFVLKCVTCLHTVCACSYSTCVFTSLCISASISTQARINKPLELQSGRGWTCMWITYSEHHLVVMLLMKSCVFKPACVKRPTPRQTPAC